MPHLPKNFKRVSRPPVPCPPESVPNSDLPKNPRALKTVGLSTPFIHKLTTSYIKGGKDGRDSSSSQETHWVLRGIEVGYTLNGETRVRKREIVAKVLGQVAVFHGIRGDGLWSVTALSVGLRIVALSSEEEALKMGAYLWSRFRGALMMGTVEDVRAKLPQWVAPWLKACAEVGVFREPIAFESKGGES